MSRVREARVRTPGADHPPPSGAAASSERGSAGCWRRGAQSAPPCCVAGGGRAARPLRRTGGPSPRRTPAHRPAASCRRLQGCARRRQVASSGLVPAAPGQAAAPVSQTRWRCAFCSGWRPVLCLPCRRRAGCLGPRTLFCVAASFFQERQVLGVSPLFSQCSDLEVLICFQLLGPLDPREGDSAPCHPWARASPHRRCFQPAAESRRHRTWGSRRLSPRGRLRPFGPSRRQWESRGPTSPELLRPLTPSQPWLRGAWVAPNEGARCLGRDPPGAHTAAPGSRQALRTRAPCPSRPALCTGPTRWDTAGPRE